MLILLLTNQRFEIMCRKNINDHGSGFTVCYRVWDISSGSEVKKIDLDAAPTSLELSHDGSVVTVTYGSTTSFWNAET